MCLHVCCDVCVCVAPRPIMPIMGGAYVRLVRMTRCAAMWRLFCCWPKALRLKLPARAIVDRRARNAIVHRLFVVGEQCRKMRQTQLRPRLGRYHRSSGPDSPKRGRDPNRAGLGRNQADSGRSRAKLGCNQVNMHIGQDRVKFGPWTEPWFVGPTRPRRRCRAKLVEHRAESGPNLFAVGSLVRSRRKTGGANPIWRPISAELYLDSTSLGRLRPNLPRIRAGVADRARSARAHAARACAHVETGCRRPCGWRSGPSSSRSTASGRPTPGPRRPHFLGPRPVLRAASASSQVVE